LTDNDRALPESATKPTRFIPGYPENEEALFRRPLSIRGNAFALEGPEASAPDFVPEGLVPPEVLLMREAV